MDQQILRRPEVERVTGLSKPTLYRYIATGTFPKPVKLGVRSVGWRVQDIQKWLDSRSHGSANMEEAST